MRPLSGRQRAAFSAADLTLKRPLVSAAAAYDRTYLGAKKPVEDLCGLTAVVTMVN
jgi:hypothetical protein